MTVSPSKPKKTKKIANVMFIWACILISIIFCLWNTARLSSSATFSIDQNEQHQQHDGEWHNNPPLITSKTVIIKNKASVETNQPKIKQQELQIEKINQPQLRLWYLPHLGHPWLEWMAAQHNLTWGACQVPHSPLYAPWCPATPIQQQLQACQVVAVPLPPHSQSLGWTWKQPNNPPPLPQPDILRRPKQDQCGEDRYVAVLRNPYHRLIDLYYHLIERHDAPTMRPTTNSDTGESSIELLNYNANTTIWDGPCRTPIRRLDDQEYYHDPVQLNAHIIRWLKKLRTQPCLQDCWFLPQYEYLHTYDKNRSKTWVLVDHLIHYEQLAQEWDELSRHYQMPLTLTPASLPQYPFNCSLRYVGNKSYVFTEYDLSPTALALIHLVYAMDFQLGNYTQLPIKPYTWPTLSYSATGVDSISNFSTLKNNKNNNNNNTRTLLPPRLELLHIPKTGGTMLELWAAKSNITWGACHFEVPWKWRKGSELRHCPVDSVRDVHFYTDFPLWHAPRYMLPHHVPFDPYDNLQDDMLRQRPPRYFVVLRNPYSRLISLFYMNYATMTRRNVTKCMDTPQKLNLLLRQWFRQMLLNSTTGTPGSEPRSINPTYEPYDPDQVCHHACAFLPQAHYILPPHLLPLLSLDRRWNFTTATGSLLNHSMWNRSTWKVDHVLHMENLEQELERLLKQYYPEYFRLMFDEEQLKHGHEHDHGGISRRSKIVINANRCKTKLTANDLDMETLNQIHSLYALDFVLGGYPMIQAS